MINNLIQKLCKFYQGCSAVWSAVSYNKHMSSDIIFFPMTNTCNHSGLELSFLKELGTLQELSWSEVPFRKEPSQKWRTVGSTNLLIHTDSSGDEEVLLWSWMDIRVLEYGPGRKLGRVVFCSHLPWGKSRANSMIQMELVQISAGLNENIVFIC